MKRKSKFLDFIFNWCEREYKFIFGMVLLNVTASWVTYGHLFKGFKPFLKESAILGNDIAISFFMLSVIDFIFYFVLQKNEKILKTAKFILLAVNVLMFCTDIFTLYYFQIPLNNIMFEAVMMTTFRESTEFAQTYFANLRFWLFAVVVVTSAVCIFALLSTILRTSLKIRLAVFITFFVISCLALIRMACIYGGTTLISRSFNTVGITRLANLFYTNYENIKNYKKMISETPKSVKLIKNERAIPYIIYVLGESTNRNHMNLYGYRLPNNPLLSQRKNNRGGVYVFDDTISPEAGTAASMKKIFSFFNYESNNEWFTSQNIFSILKTAGYHTFWISNQEGSALSGTSPSAFFSKLCDVQKFTNTFAESTYRSTIYDEELLPLIEKELNSFNEKNFFVIHLMGTHYFYHKRYPVSFRKFMPSDEDPNKTPSQREILADYDNAILYNDFIINEIIKLFENKNAVLIYISDHGEGTFDKTDLIGHYGIDDPNMIEIPFIIWLSEKFRAQYPELEKRIASSVHRPYMTDDIIHTILDIAGIETPDYIPERSVINEKFNEARPRIFLNFIYDKEKGLNAS